MSAGPNLVLVRIEQDLEEYLNGLKLRIQILETEVEDMKELIKEERVVNKKAVKAAAWAFLGLSVALVVLVIKSL